MYFVRFFANDFVCCLDLARTYQRVNLSPIRNVVNSCPIEGLNGEWKTTGWTGRVIITRVTASTSKGTCLPGGSNGVCRWKSMDINFDINNQKFRAIFTNNDNSRTTVDANVRSQANHACSKIEWKNNATPWTKVQACMFS